MSRKRELCNIVSLGGRSVPALNHILVTVVTLKVIIAVTHMAVIDLLHFSLFNQVSRRKHCF